MSELHCKLGKILRARLIANSAALKVTTKKKRADGTLMVFCPQVHQLDTYLHPAFSKYPKIGFAFAIFVGSS